MEIAVACTWGLNHLSYSLNSYIAEYIRLLRGILGAQTIISSFRVLGFRV